MSSGPSMAMQQVVSLAIFAGVGILVAFLVRQANARRRKALQELGQALGFSYSERDDSVLPLIASFKVYRRSHTSEHASNVLRRKNQESEIAVFDYYWRHGHGKNSTSANQTVIHFSSVHLNLPDFALSPEHFFHKLGEMVGFKDIDFSDHPDFSRKCRLVGADEDAVRSFFTDAKVSALEGIDGITVEGRGSDLVVYRSHRLAGPDDLRGFIETGLGVFGLMRADARG